MKEKIYTGAEIRAIRNSLGLSQPDFWGRLGITQPAGLRYETARNKISAALQKLLTIACGSDQEVAAMVKELRGNYTRVTPIIREDKTIDTRRLRQDVGLGQIAFWKKVCVSESGGSLYESGRRRILLRLYKLLIIAYGSDQEAATMVQSIRGQCETVGLSVARRQRTKRTKENLYASAELRAMRGKLALKQKDFWERVGSTLGSGSHYETGRRKMPDALQKLLTIAYGSDEEVAAMVKKLRGDYTRATPIIGKDKTIDTRRLRQDVGLSQIAFWEKVCVAQQVGGSHYEKKKQPIPLPVYKLLVIVYGSDEEAVAMVKAVRQ